MNAINVQVKVREGESSERLIRRFFKKCKKVDIVREHLDKVSFARSKSQKKRAKIQKNKYLRKIEALKAERKFILDNKFKKV